MVVVTNGDNLYDPRFVAEVEKAEAGGADVVAFDYYSRFQRPTGAESACNISTPVHAASTQLYCEHKKNLGLPYPTNSAVNSI